MSMTQEQALKLLEHPIYKWSMDWDEREDGLNYTEAIEIAIAALRPVSREQVERIWFREPYTRMETRITPEGNRQYIAENICMACGNKTPIGHFCHNCGVALDTWAVDMMLKRMEEIYK